MGVDPDAVFLPNRLQGWLSSRTGESPHGVYFENCKNVQYGFFGNLEVMSHEATNVLTKYLEDCHAVYAPCANDGCDWQYGAWGEDVFVQRCLDRHYVDKVEAFDMTFGRRLCGRSPRGPKEEQEMACRGLQRGDDSSCASIQDPQGVLPLPEPDDCCEV